MHSSSRIGGRFRILSLQLHGPLHRRHVVVEVRHDPQRSDNQHKNDKNAEHRSHHVVNAVRPGGDVKEEDDVNAHLRDRQHDQRGRNAGLPDQRRAGDKERHDREENRQPNTDQLTENAFG